MAKNIHSCLHRFIEMSFIVLIIFEAVTQIFSCHSFVTAYIYLYYSIISKNYDAKFNSDPEAENRNKIPWLIFEK